MPDSELFTPACLSAFVAEEAIGLVERWLNGETIPDLTNISFECGYFRQELSFSTDTDSPGGPGGRNDIVAVRAGKIVSWDRLGISPAPGELDDADIYLI